MTYKRYENYKDSGVEGIGKMPEHWQQKKLKYLVKTTKGFAFDSNLFEDFGIPVIKATDIKNGSVQNASSFIDPNLLGEYKNVLLCEDDILISTVGSKPEVINSAVGQVAKVSKEIEGALLNQNTVILRVKTIMEVLRQYMFFPLFSYSFRKHLDLYAHGTANQASLSLQDILEYNLCVPPLQEQQQITKLITTKSKEIDSLMY